jgi:hypothetical protein
VVVAAVGEQRVRPAPWVADPAVEPAVTRATTVFKTDACVM